MHDGELILARSISHVKMAPLTIDGNLFLHLKFTHQDAAQTTFNTMAIKVTFCESDFFSPMKVANAQKLELQAPTECLEECFG